MITKIEMNETKDLSKLIHEITKDWNGVVDERIQFQVMNEDNTLHADYLLHVCQVDRDQFSLPEGEVAQPVVTEPINLAKRIDDFTSQLISGLSGTEKQLRVCTDDDTSCTRLSLYVDQVTKTAYQ